MFKLFRRVVAAMTKTVEQEAESTLTHAQGSEITKSKELTEEAGKLGEKKKRIKQAKYAMLLGYQGKQYFGMQLQKDAPTIESHLLDSMVKAGWITQEMREKPFSFFFQRAARTDKAVSAARQMCGMQLPLNDDLYQKDGARILNELLPKDIRVFGVRRATTWFHPQKLCDYRTYSYTTPTYVFAKPNQPTNSSFRITKEVIAEIDDILSIFLGTHNFFNYTAKRAFDDTSCNRYIVSFKCGEPFLFKDEFRNQDVEFISITVKGQSFVLHQIRKMIGMVITVVRELSLKSSIQRSFEGKRMDVPMAPGLGLLLEKTHFDLYDKKHAKTHQPLSDWGEVIEKEVEKAKFELITKDMLETELISQGMMKWLADLAHHNFPTDPEAELTDEPRKDSEVKEETASEVGEKRSASDTVTSEAVDEPEAKKVKTEEAKAEVSQ